MHWHLRDRILDLNDRCLVMGIVNVTPDSFSDGGRFQSTEAVIAHALDLVQQGADLLDIGGESTRPGSQPISLDEELRRVVPVVQGLIGKVQIPLSIDTSKSMVAKACLEAGAHIINDVTGLQGDPAMPRIANEFQAGVVVMHMQGTPATMQLRPAYSDVRTELFQYFEKRVQSALLEGISFDRIVLDPGIGFGKTRSHNVEILARLDSLQALGRPVCLGVSRKGFLGSVLNRPLEERLAGSLAAASFALAHSAVQILRVHDVAATRDLVTVWQTLGQARIQGTSEAR